MWIKRTVRLTNFEKLENVQRLCWLGRELVDRPAMSGGPFATRPRFTGEFTAGDSGHGLGWGLFLEVPGSLGSSLW